LNDVTQILPRPTLVAMATKFETKRAITQLVWGNITEMLAPSRFFLAAYGRPMLTPSTIRYDTIEEINVDSKAEYTA